MEPDSQFLSNLQAEEIGSVWARYRGGVVVDARGIDVHAEGLGSIVVELDRGAVQEAQAAVERTGDLVGSDRAIDGVLLKVREAERGGRAGTVVGVHRHDGFAGAGCIEVHEGKLTGAARKGFGIAHQQRKAVDRGAIGVRGKRGFEGEVFRRLVVHGRQRLDVFIIHKTRGYRRQRSRSFGGELNDALTNGCSGERRAK